MCRLRLCKQQVWPAYYYFFSKWLCGKTILFVFLDFFRNLYVGTYVYNKEIQLVYNAAPKFYLLLSQLVSVF